MFNITNTTDNFSSSVQHNNSSHDQYYSEHQTSKYFRWVCYTLVTLAAVIGNAIVIRSIFSIRGRKPLTYKLVTNVAVAELIGTIFLPLIFIYDEAYSWPFERLMCHSASPIQISSCLVITWSLAIISLHRFRMINDDTRRFRPVKEVTYKVVFGCLWVAAVIITFPSYLYSTLVKSPNGNNDYWCVVLFPGDTLNTFPSPVYRRYLLVRFVINFLAPILIMVLAYGAIGVKLKYHMATERLKTTEGLPSIEITDEDGKDVHPAMATDSCSSPIHCEEIETTWSLSPYSLTRRDNLLIKLEKDLVMMIYVIILIFLVCYFPYQVLFLLEHFDVVTYRNWKYFHITRKYVFLITCLPSALHPLCYGTMCKFYAKAFSGIVLCRWVCKAKPRATPRPCFVA